MSDDLRRYGVRVVANGFSPSAAAFLAQAPAPFDLVMLYRGSLAGGPLFDQLRAHSPAARVVFNTVDLHFLRLEREAMVTRAPGKLAEAFRAEQIELAAIARADCTVAASSPTEQMLVADLLPRARTSVIPIARDIGGRRAPVAPRAGVLFVGSFRHQPNVDAILAFVREAWPLVPATARDDAQHRRRPTRRRTVRALASAADGIVDPRLPCRTPRRRAGASCRLTVAPLRFGAGIKGKIVTSLAAGAACVASPVAVEGMGLADGVHAARRRRRRRHLPTRSSSCTSRKRCGRWL